MRIGRGSTCDVTPACTDAIIAIAKFDTNRMPSSVLLAFGRVAEIVLPAQFVGDVRGRRIQIARIADDFGAAAAVVGHVTQRDDVDAVVIALLRARPALAAAASWRTRPPAAAADA